MTAHCPACTNSEQQGQSIICTKFNVVATPRTSQDCTDFEREPGSDDVPIVWLEDAWVVA